MAVSLPGSRETPSSACSPGPHPNTLWPVFPGGTQLLWVQAESLGPPWGTQVASCCPLSAGELPSQWPAGTPHRGDGASRVCFLTCLLHQEQGREDPGQRQAPTQGTHPGGWHGGGRWPGGSGPQCSLPGGPGAYIAGSLGPEPSCWATQGSVLSPEAATCVCSRGGASAGKTPGGGRICGCGPLPPLSPLPRPSATPENQRERGGHLVPGRWCRRPILGGRAPACGHLGRPGPVSLTQ